MNPMRIAIVDDVMDDAESLRTSLQAVSTDLSCPCAINIYADGESFLETGCRTFDMVFLDVEMPGMDGLETARRMRAVNTDMVLIFVTTYEKYAIAGYTVNAYRYLVKPVTTSELRTCCQGPMEGYRQRNTHVFYAKCRQQVERVPWREILYFETQGNHQVVMHTVEGDKTLYTSLSQVEQALEQGPFVRSHASFLVNVEFVRKIGDRDLTLQDGRQVPVSRHRKQALLKQFCKRLQEGYV